LVPVVPRREYLANPLNSQMFLKTEFRRRGPNRRNSRYYSASATRISF
jgi:hypothetical protein